jgi:hypothetical protein
MKWFYRYTHICVFSFFAAFSSLNAVAAIVTLTAEGTVAFVSPNISSGFSTGDKAVYELVYDTSSPNSLGNPAFYDTAISTFSVTIGSYSATSSAGKIDIYDNISSMDLFSVTARPSDGLSGASVGGHDLERIFFQLWDEDMTWLDSVALPTSYLLADDYENKVFRVDFTGNSYLKGNLEMFTVQISQVPVPPAVWLFGSGLIGLIAVARRRLC